MQTFFLFFPLAFTFGLFPQINTFALSVCEQVEIYLFGGTAQHSLTSALLNLTRSCLSILILTCILFFSSYSYWPTLTNEANSLAVNALTAAKQSQYAVNVVFSLYCALLIVVAFLLSRQTSDCQTILRAIFKHFIKKSSNTLSGIKQKNTKQKSSSTNSKGMRNESLNISKWNFSSNSDMFRKS